MDNGRESEIPQTGATIFGDEDICLLKSANEQEVWKKVN